ncbi:AraC family transcriptional regulator [Enterococcus sp. 2201sp1_2201st1_B8_2201SCRN_220225]|uniref:helix-turn-helix transcriptional regulator n=1 Tax=unclassified Enterococcus TaxID=2608891 RepID=UPI0034A58C92
MQYVNPQTFNPEILYLFDPWNKSDNYNKLHSHEFLEISIILEGEVMYQFAQEPARSLHAGDVLLFNPGVMHQEWQKTNTHSHQLHIGLKNISLDGLKRNFFPNKTPLLNLGRYQHQVIEQAWGIIKEMNYEQFEFQLMHKGQVLQILAYILRGLNEDENSITPRLSASEKRHQQIVNQVIYFIENHYSEEVTLEKLAQDHFVSPTYLSRIFKETVGMGPINYLIQIRLAHAADLLKEGKTTIKEVAQMVGYQDAYHFSKSFKKQYGTTPSAILSKERS